MNISKVIAKTYITDNGQVLLELCSLGRGKYIVARNGQIPDARRKLNRADAAEWITSTAATVIIPIK